MRKMAIMMWLTGAAWAAEPLSLREAVQKALTGNPAMQAGAEGEKAATARAQEARGGRLPRADYTESWTRSDNPVYVFGSLLEQRKFTASDFSLGFLNYPPFLNNFQSRITVRQDIWDGGLRGARERAASLGRDAAHEGARGVEIMVIAQAIGAYYDAELAREGVKVAGDAVKSAQADLKRAQDRRSAGMATDADVLSIRVHEASAQEELIRRKAEAELAMARLATVMGAGVDSQFDLTTPLQAARSIVMVPEGEAETDAEKNRPEVRLALIQSSIRDTQVRAAKAAMLPQFFIEGMFEADRQEFFNKGGANWTIAAGMRWNLFNGFSDTHEREAARHDALQARANERQAAAAVKVEAKRAWLETQSAQQQLEVAGTATSMAEESLRIIRNRYAAGLADVTDLLHAETALVEAKTNSLRAARDQRLAAVEVEAAKGTLNRDSEVVNQ